MSSMVVDSLQKQFGHDAGVAIAYIYCSYQPQQEQRSEDLLSSLLKQLIMRQEEIPTRIKELYESHKDYGTRASIYEITRTLRDTVQIYSKVFIVVDALDEYHASNHEGLKELLSAVFVLQSQGPVNFFATSRHIPEVASQFDSGVTKEIRAQDDDLLQYLDGQIPKLLRSTISKHPSKLQDTVREEIVKAADGMWVQSRS